MKSLLLQDRSILVKKQIKRKPRPLHRRKNGVKRGIVWITQQKDKLYAGEMETTHLFYAIKMLFNHTVPSSYAFVGFKPYDIHMSVEERTEKVKGLLEELALRGNEITLAMISDLRYMEQVTRMLHQKSFVFEGVPLLEP